MTSSILTGVNLTDVSVTATMASLERVDKVIVLRSADPRNRVQLNFRAISEDGHYGDLVVQEIKDCVFTKYTSEGAIAVPHAMGEKIAVSVDLIGTHLAVQVNQRAVFEGDVPVAIRAGDVGVGVIDHSTTVFDDLVIRSRD